MRLPTLLRNRTGDDEAHTPTAPDAPFSRGGVNPSCDTGSRSGPTRLDHVGAGGHGGPARPAARGGGVAAGVPPDLPADHRRRGRAVDAGVFEDARWVEAWDVAFAGLYLAALDADLDGTSGVPRPWRHAFDAPASLHPLQHVLLGINAHVNHDLPQALLAVISDDDFADPTLLARRRRDHEQIDGVLAAQVAAEDGELARQSSRSLLDRILAPLNRWASRRFLREARKKVWHNTVELQRARAPARMSTPPGWRSWRSSAPRGSPTFLRRGPCCSSWRSRDSGSSCHQVRAGAAPALPRLDGDDHRRHHLPAPRRPPTGRGVHLRRVRPRSRAEPGRLPLPPRRPGLPRGDHLPGRGRLDAPGGRGGRAAAVPARRRLVLQGGRPAGDRPRLDRGRRRPNGPSCAATTSTASASSPTATAWTSRTCRSSGRSWCARRRPPTTRRRAAR